MVHEKSNEIRSFETFTSVGTSIEINCQAFNYYFLLTNFVISGFRYKEVRCIKDN
ncbi:hypothetical protein BpHYR1_052416 [Brachionus plicatilis]|uniref:Uncharacterized protein n=1 Tax=Brachionus plicatilis TaxID=10195 RepID=A0A3M7Q414_BRAPC|nr:hypothetical protein BpHYR1_052416 [Brachionus plicatilis]